MKDKNIQELVGALKKADLRLPAHQRALRVRLLAQYRYGLLSPRRLFAIVEHRVLTLRPFFTMKNGLRFGVSAVTVGAILLSALILRSAVTTDPARQLAMIAVHRVRHMSPAQLNQISQAHEALDRCLEEAAQSDTLRIMSTLEGNALIHTDLREAYPSTRVYLTYINGHHHRIIIALDDRNEPLYAIDITKGVTELLSSEK